MRTLPYLFLLLLAVGGSRGTHAAEPTAQIRATTDKILTVLQDPVLNTDARRLERRQLMRGALDQRIDWPTVARSSLGRHWARRTPAEQAEFVSLFGCLLEETFIGKFETYYGDMDRIDYVGEKVLDAYASVKSQITTKDQIVHPVEYRLQKFGADWRIYDVLLEGVSLVKNYRDQFEEILARSSYQQLVADLRAKMPQESP